MKRAVFRDLVEAPEILMMPVVHDALCARIAEQAGFKVICTAGYANSASLLGSPDIGLLTMTEMVDCADRIVNAVDIPVFSDADTGYGGVANVKRTVMQFEKAGVVGIVLEDQSFPKKCGHMSDKSLISPQEMVNKISAAVGSRDNYDFVIMARTDAVSVNGIDNAIQRANMYKEAGADMIFVEALRSVSHIKKVIDEVPGPHMANIIPGGKTPMLSAEYLEEIGYSIVAFPTANTYMVARASIRLFEHLKDYGELDGLEDEMMGFDRFNELVGLPEIRSREHTRDP